MKLKLINFQQKAVDNLHKCVDMARYNYGMTHVPQVISFTAPTGSGKTMILRNCGSHGKSSRHLRMAE